MRDYFVTGATGVVGSALCRRLLLRPEVRLRLLIRGKSDEEVGQRLNELITFWRMADAAIRPRVSALRGDAAKPRFDLSTDEYESLVRNCTNIVHSAGAVRMNLSIDAARRSALDSAHAIVELANNCTARGRAVKTEFLSTVGVGGKLPGPLPERWIDEPRSYHNTYEQAKAEAEVVAKDAIKSGLHITVHRPSMVVGDSKSGHVVHFQVFYHLAEFLSGQRTFGFTPDTGAATLDLIPSDYVAAAIEWSSVNSSQTGKIFHLCSGPEGALTIRALLAIVRREFEAHGLSLPTSRTVPQTLYKVIIAFIAKLSSDRNRRALATLPVFLDYLADMQSFSNTNTVATLNDVGIRLPLATQYVPIVLQHYLQQCSPMR